MQIHTVQCAKYRLFQEGYSVTPQMHSCDISCLAGIFYFLFFFFFFSQDCWPFIVKNPECPWWMVTGKDIFFSLFPLFICQFSVNCHLLMAFSQYAYFLCSCEASSTVQFKVCNLPSINSTPLCSPILSSTHQT